MLQSLPNARQKRESICDSDIPFYGRPLRNRRALSHLIPPIVNIQQFFPSRRPLVRVICLVATFKIGGLSFGSRQQR